MAPKQHKQKPAGATGFAAILPVSFAFSLGCEWRRLEGVMEYRSGQTLYLLEPGETLTLRGEVLHGFERLIQLPVRFYCTIVHSGADS
jgi:hypothetical protein